MPGLRLTTQRGWFSLLFGLALVVTIMTLTSQDHQNLPPTVAGQQDVRKWSKDARSLKNATAHGFVPYLGRRANTASTSAHSSLASVDDTISQSQEDDGEQGKNALEIEENYNKALSRVRDLQHGTEQSNFDDISKLLGTGWRRMSIEAHLTGKFSDGAAIALEALGIPLEVGWEWHRFYHGDGQQAVVDGMTATNAYYLFAVNPRHRVMVVLDSAGPAHTVQTKAKQLDPKKFPKLKHWSDIAFIEWAAVCEEQGVKPASLKYIVRNHITNPETRNVARKVVGGFLATHLKEWPGNQYEAPQEQLQALCGTPNGIGVGHMLAQHSDAMGLRRRVVKAVLFKTPEESKEFQKGGPNLFMLMQLNEAQDSRPESPDPNAAQQRSSSLPPVNPDSDTDSVSGKWKTSSLPPGSLKSSTGSESGSASPGSYTSA